jgi:hypothetical protein
LIGIAREIAPAGFDIIIDDYSRGTGAAPGTRITRMGSFFDTTEAGLVTAGYASRLTHHESKLEGCQNANGMIGW